jgi:hypothetical protein
MPKHTERISFICANCGCRGTKRLVGPGSSRIWCARCENAAGNVDDQLDAIMTMHSCRELSNTREVLAAVVLQLGGSFYLSDFSRARVNSETVLSVTQEVDGGITLSVSAGTPDQSTHTVDVQ